jgi:HEAT repeat protein
MNLGVSWNLPSGNLSVCCIRVPAYSSTMDSVPSADDVQPLMRRAAVTALGFLWDPHALPAILRHAGHPAANVRHSVAFAIPGAAGDPPSPAAVDALIALSADPDSEARDWATFGLGTQFADEGNDAIRDALAARLDDPDGNTPSACATEDHGLEDRTGSSVEVDGRARHVGGAI